jgi:hypothetical protein
MTQAAASSPQLTPQDIIFESRYKKKTERQREHCQIFANLMIERFMFVVKIQAKAREISNTVNLFR